MAAAPQPTTPITQFNFSGSRAIASKVLVDALAQTLASPLNFGELIETVQARYKAAGYFLAQATLRQQRLQPGAVEVKISEGRVTGAPAQGEDLINASNGYIYTDFTIQGQQEALLRIVWAQVQPTVIQPNAVAVQAAANPENSSNNDDARVNVTQFDFIGNTALSNRTLREALAKWSGRPLNFGDLIEAVEAVEATYKAAGYFLAQASLPPQKIRDGAIEITVSEGRLNEVRIEGESHIGAETIYAYTDRIAKGEPLILHRVERQILLINELAGGRASLDLQAGPTEGSTDVVLALTPENFVSGRLEANNHGAPSTGENRVGLTLNANSLFNRGEKLTFNALTSDTSGLLAYTLRGDVPLGGAGWRVAATASRAIYSLGGTFASLNASGTADSLRLGLSYPLIRSRSQNLRMQLEADQSTLNDNFRSSNTELGKTSNGATLTFSADSLDGLGGGGANRFDLALRQGYLSMNPTSAAQDAGSTGLKTQGGFGKILINASRQQALGKDLSLQLALTLQQASNNLDSSEKLSMGGPQTLPGYGNGEAVGDSGYLVKLSTRWQVRPDMALGAFTNVARLTLSYAPLATTTNNERTITDYGLSADWQFLKTFSANAFLARSLQPANVDADTFKTRFWLTVAYGW